MCFLWLQLVPASLTARHTKQLAPGLVIGLLILEGMLLAKMSLSLLAGGQLSGMFGLSGAVLRFIFNSIRAGGIAVLFFLSFRSNSTHPRNEVQCIVLHLSANFNDGRSYFSHFNFERLSCLMFFLTSVVLNLPLGIFSCLSFSHTHTRTHSLTHTHTHSLIHTHTRTHSLAHTPTPAFDHMHTHTLFRFGNKPKLQNKLSVAA